MFGFVMKYIKFYLLKEEMNIFWEQNDWVTLEAKCPIQVKSENKKSGNECPAGKSFSNCVFQ